MILHQSEECTVALPLPLFLVIEDVGWWQGEDGSGHNEPYRNGLCRRHCLADYQALVALSERLSMRIAIAMVIGEWDRTNLLRDVAGATWMGRAWDNRSNQGPWLDQAAAYLRSCDRNLELAVHGLCHEFWHNGQMLRAEFHDNDGFMRPREIVVTHLEAYAAILKQNGFLDFPRLFVPPALKHSFGNGEDSMQAVLKTFGITHVTTRFAKARQYRPPVHPGITWECGVAILERGLSPVAWHQMAAVAETLPLNPVVALHWGNLLHADPERNGEIVERWAARLLAEAAGFGRMLATDVADCWRQAAVYYLARVRLDDRAVIIDLRGLPPLPSLTGPFSLKIREKHPRPWRCSGAEVVSRRTDQDRISTVRLQPAPGCPEIRIDLS